MISLAVKYRPKTFQDIVEQDAIKMILEEQLFSETFKHAYLFCGPAGDGKTTTARIFAYELNKGKGNPIEVDAASNNGVDNVREIIDNAKRKPLDSDFKVYIIDECHMLSTGAWNAMLKLLEEPPKCTIFIMCTTDPQKIPATILSRVQRYDFSKISLDGIVARLKYIMNMEGEEIDPVNNTATDVIPYEEEAIQYIAKLADGGMRDAITMLDKCLSLSTNVTLENVVKALGTVDYTTHFELLYSLATGSVSLAIEILEKVYNSGKDIKQFIKQFQYFMLDVCKYQLFKNFKYVQIPELPEYKQRIEDESYEDCVDILDWVRELNANIKWESNAKAIIESDVVLYCKEVQA
jgi:DNA polymerase-3 subunit gamma/tau